MGYGLVKSHPDATGFAKGATAVMLSHKAAAERLSGGRDSGCMGLDLSLLELLATT